MKMVLMSCNNHLFSFLEMAVILVEAQNIMPPPASPFVSLSIILDFKHYMLL